MQLVFGTAGIHPDTETVFSRLASATVASTPDLEPAVARGSTLSLGYVARTWSEWREGDLSLYLDGYISEVDGAPTPSGCSTADELASLARLYRRRPFDLWTRLDGNFLLLLQHGQDVHIGVDVAGTRSVYWWVCDGVLAFHTHLLDLAACHPNPLAEDLASLGSYLACGAYPPGRTPFAEIYHLSPGHSLRFVNSHPTQHEHFRLAFPEPPPRPRRRAELIDELATLLRASITALWSRADHPIIPLSGGVDSRYILAEAARTQSDLRSIVTVTWGVDRGRQASDAVIASHIADILGIPNIWYDRLSLQSAEVFRRMIYLSSGEADAAIHYPDEHLLATYLRQQGFSSLFRGDECFGRDTPLLTHRAVLAVNDITHLSYDTGYSAFLDPDLVEAMSASQDQALADFRNSLRSGTPTGQRDEVYYSVRMRQVLAIFNRVKHSEIEVYNPLLRRTLLEWTTTVPDHLRNDKMLFREALRQTFPTLGAIPFATRSNRLDWELQFRRDLRISRFYHDWCSEAGWLDKVGAKRKVLVTLEAIGRTASVRAREGTPQPQEMRLGHWKRRAKQTIPGRLIREMVLERRYAARTPEYLRIARLAVLHELLGRPKHRPTSTMDPQRS